MSIITAHWSASSDQKLGEYHLEFGRKSTIDTDYNKSLLYQITKPDPAKINWAHHLNLFNIYKNFSFSQATNYGTWMLNKDPKNGEPNIEIASLTMGGSDVSIQSWGENPHLISHSLIHAYLMAIVCKLKNINPLGHFDVSVEPSVLQNGPIYSLSTHAERSWQTQDEGEGKIPDLGYFIFSGDPDSRWDLAALDPTEAHKLSNANSAVKTCRFSANWLRNMTNQILEKNIIKDYLGLDK